MYIEQGTAKQIESDYQQVTKNSAEVVLLLLQKLRANNAIAKKSSHLVEIKIDNKLVYKGKTGQQPSVNRLNSLQINMLESVINSASAKDLFVSVDGKPVYHSLNGIVEIDRLSSQPQTIMGVSNCSPQAQNTTVAKEVRNIQALTGAKQILDALGIDEYQSENYHFKRDGNNLLVSSKESDEEIVRIKDGMITGNASEKDIFQIQDLEKSVSHQVKSQSVAANSNNTSQEIERD